MKRGQLWVREGREVYLVVSADVLNGILPTVWGLLVDEHDPGVEYPLAVAVDDHDDRPPLWVLTTQIRTVAAEALTGPLDTLEPDTMQAVDRALLRVAGLNVRGRPVGLQQ